MWWTQPWSIDVRVGSGVALLVREDRDQPPVARVEVEMALGCVVEVRLLEDERHAEHAFPEVDRRLAPGTDDRDVVDALALELPHHRSTSVDLYSLRCKAAPRHELDLHLDHEHFAQPAGGLRRRGASAPRRAGDSSTETGSGGSCFTPACRGLTRMRPLTSGANRADDLANRRREDVDAADDQHVVGAADAADARRRSSARARAGPDLDLVARAEAQQRRGLVAQVRENELAACAVTQLAAARPSPDRSARRGRTRARRGASRPAPRTRPRATGRCRRSPSPPSPGPPSPPRAPPGTPGSPPPGSPATRIRRTLESRRSPSSSR